MYLSFGKRKKKPSSDSRGAPTLTTAPLAELQKHAGLAAASGLARIINASGSKLVSSSIEGNEVRFSVSNEIGTRVARIDLRFLELVAPLFLNGRNSTIVEEIASDMWPIKSPKTGPLPLALLPLNAAIWKAAGFGTETVSLARDTEYEFSSNSDDLYAHELGKLANTFGVLDEQTREDLSRSVGSRISPRISAFMAWLRYEWKTQGTTLFASSEIKRVAEKLDLSASNLMTIASFYCDAGEYGLALRFAKKAKAKNAQVWHASRIPAVTRLLVKERIIEDGWAIEEAELCDLIDRTSNEFPSLIRQNINSFALVANGPTQLGKGRGEFIDSKNVIIRMNTGGLARAPHAEDYGSRQNVWLRNMQNYDVKRMGRIPGVDRVLISGSNPVYKKVNSGRYLREIIDIYGSLNMVPEDALRKTIADTKRNPSSGIVMLSWMNELAGNLVDQENVFGFSLTDQKVRETTHYFRGGPINSHHTHDWDVERAYFEKLIKSK